MRRKKFSDRAKPITPRTVRGLAVALAVLWTCVIGVVLFLSYRSEMTGAEQAATIAARAQFRQDIVYRRWNANLGGVYAEVSEQLKPNPYLADHEERDIVTPSGRRLTLINPAFMTRGVHELALRSEGIRGHITSLDPIRPENAADAWESAALAGFEEENDEFFQVQELAGEKYLRLMRPLVTEESCLQCHGDQGYKVGEIRGGISVSVPMEEYYSIGRRDFAVAAVEYGTLWLIGLAGIAFGGSAVGKRARQQMEAEKRVATLLGEREMMLREIQHRIKNNMSTMAGLLQLRAESLDTGEGQEALRDVAGRFSIMMRLYDKLYRSTDLQAIPLSDYLPEVIDELVRTSTTTGQVSLQVDIAPVTLDADTLSAVGIFVAEALTNALKYAATESGELILEIEALQSDGEVALRIRDNGPGLAFPGQTATTPGLGLQLMEALARQLGGKMSLESESVEGTEVVLVFPLPEING